MSKLFKRLVRVTSGPVKMNNTDLDIEFDIPFDDDLDPNLATLTVYNLSETTINQLKQGQDITIIAGYLSDSGVVFDGEIASVRSKWIDADKVTVIKLLDSVPYKADKTVNVTYKKNITAESIIRDLAKRIGLKIAVLRLPQKKVYKNGHTVNGGGLQALQSIAVDCGASCYISRGQTYIRPLTDGDDYNFQLNSDTGLIGSPEYFENDLNGKTEKGYSFTSLLQHRMNTAGIVYLKSREVNAKVRIKKGRHVCRDTEFYTRVEAIL